MFTSLKIAQTYLFCSFYYELSDLGNLTWNSVHRSAWNFLALLFAFRPEVQIQITSHRMWWGLCGSARWHNVDRRPLAMGAGTKKFQGQVKLELTSGVRWREGFVIATYFLGSGFTCGS
jgi:hypothetical protein